MPNSGILMVTGVYYPEVNGAANLCRQLVNELKKKLRFTVLTTTQNPNLPRQCKVDGIELFRIFLGKRILFKNAHLVPKLIMFFFSNRNQFQIIHMFGFSNKSIILVFLAKIFQKRVVIQLTSVGHDDHQSMRNRGFFINWFFSKADIYVGLSPRFHAIYKTVMRRKENFRLISTGIDTRRFCPVNNDEKSMLRGQLGLYGKKKWILFVGHFSREKCPNILLDAWKRYVADLYPDTGIIFIGSLNPNHYEVDSQLVNDIKKLADSYVDRPIIFIERTHVIEQYYQSADIFVLPSLREGMPNALLEAMACSLSVIVSRLEGVTDWVVNDGINGLLVKPGISDDLGRAIEKVLNDDDLAETFGLQARKTIEDRFSIHKIAEQYGGLYGDLVLST